MRTVHCEVCGARAAEYFSLCVHHVQAWTCSVEYTAALRRPGAEKDDAILAEALDSYIERAKRERTWIQ